MRPPRSTTARSATSNTWSMACETTTTALRSLAQPQNQIEHLARLAHAERGGRLVEDDDLRCEGRGPADGDRLPLPAGHQPDHRVEVGDGHLQALEHLARLVGHLTALQEAQRARQPRRPCELSAGVEVVGRPHVVEEREILIDRLDAPAPARRRASGSRLLFRPSRPLRCRSGTRPFRRLIRVDLPAPLSPSSASNSPLHTWRSMSSSADTAPKRLRAPRTVNAGGLCTARVAAGEPGALMRTSRPERRARAPRCSRAGRRPRRRSARSRRSPSAGRRGRRCGG